LLKNKQARRITSFGSPLLLSYIAIIISALFVLSLLSSFISTTTSIILDRYLHAALAFKPTPPPQHPTTSQQRNVQQVQYSFVRAWGSHGTKDGRFQGPEGVAIDSSGNVYVTDFANGRVQKFDSNGNFIAKWGSQGTGDGQFDNPGSIAVDSNTGNVYVADTGNNRIQAFAPQK
jgi:NHL repeat